MTTGLHTPPGAAHLSGGPAAQVAARLLVVDDNEMNRDLLSRRLRRLGHEVAVAVDGREALAMLAQAPVDLVLLDIMMPELNGYEVLTRIKGDAGLRHVPVIMISAVDDMASVVRCIELGAEDYLPKPFDPVLLKARVGACLEKKRLHDQAARHARSLERELEIGREIQAGFLPDVLPQPAGWQIAACFHPARQVSGDFYDAFPLPGGELVMLVVADVCDKGVGAALFMALFRSLFRAVASQEDDGFGADPLATPPTLPTATVPGDALADGERRLRRAMTVTNDYIARTHGRANMFATFFAAVLEPGTGRLHYVNGGHEPPVVVANGVVRAHLAPTGPAVGMLPDLTFGVGALTLAEGEYLAIYTDGVSEARAPDGAFLPETALLAMLVQPASGAAELLDRIQERLAEHTRGGEPSDDVTMLVAWRG